jgi:hypothetical protein
MAHLAVVGIGLYLCTTIGAQHLGKGMTALLTKHRFGLIDGSTSRADLSFGLSLLLVELANRTVRHDFLAHLLRTESGVHIARRRYIIVIHIMVVIKKSDAKLHIFFVTTQKNRRKLHLRRHFYTFIDFSLP